MTKRKDQHISSPVPAKMRERTVDDYSDLAEVIRENAAFDTEGRGKPVSERDRAAVFAAAQLLTDELPLKQAITISWWVYWNLIDDEEREERRGD
jgi:hypothetical protein